MKILYSKGDHDLLFNLNLASVVMRFVVDVFPFKSQTQNSLVSQDSSQRTPAPATMVNQVLWLS